MKIPLAVILAIVATVIPVFTAAAATDPAQTGVFSSGLASQTLQVGSAQLATDIHYPGSGGTLDPTAGRCPLIVFGHGFSSSKDMYVGHGAHWASRGYIVLIPNLVGGSDHSRNADDLVGLVDWALAQDLDPASFLFGRVDRAAIGSSGHSAGGLSSLVAAARDPRIRATAPFDPVDINNLGVNAMASITAPVAITYSEDGACNANGSSRDLYAAAVPIKRGLQIVGANHCDPLDPLQALCDIFCGGTSTAMRQELYRRHVTAWFEYWLRCDPGYLDWVYGSFIQAEVSDGKVLYDAVPDPGPTACGAAPGPVVQLLMWKQSSDVEMSWTPVAATPTVSEYRWYRGYVMPFAYGAPEGRPAASRATDIGGISGGSPAFYQVRAVNSFGEGP